MKNAVYLIFEIFIFSSIMIFFTFGIKRLISIKLNYKIMALLWFVVLVRLLLPFTVESPIHINIADRLFENTFTQNVVIDDTNLLADAENTLNKNSAPINTENTQIENSPKEIIEEHAFYQKTNDLISKIKLWNVIFLIWMVGAIIIYVKSMYSILTFNKKLNKISTNNRCLIKQITKAKNITGVKRDIKIIETRLVNTPLVFGIFQPIILLPTSFAKSIDNDKLFLVILHEMCHVKRWDTLINYLWLVAKTLHWYNPLVHIAYKSYLEDVENTCDEMVLSLITNDEKYDYTQSLLDVFRFSKNKTRLTMSVSFCDNQSDISKRINNLVKPHKKSKMLGITTVLISLVMIIACFTTACMKAETVPTDANMPIENIVEEIEDTENEMIESPDMVINFQGDEVPIPKLITVNDGKLAAKQFEYLSQSKIEQIEFLDSKDFFGDEILYYMCDDPSVMFRILGSDGSLVSFHTKEVDLFAPIALLTDEYERIVIDYIKQIWNMDNIQILSQEIETYDDVLTDENSTNGKFQYETRNMVIVEGTMGDNDRPFYATLNGKGELRAIMSWPNDVDFEKGITLAAAKKIALDSLKEYSFTKDINKLTLINESLELEFSPVYNFEYEYRTDHPTIQEFDYNYRASIMVSTGIQTGLLIEPIVTNIDVIQLDEAEQLAKEHIAQKSISKDVASYITTASYAIINEGHIEYVFSFDYIPDNPTESDPQYVYTIYMSAETGVLFDIGSTRIN